MSVSFSLLFSSSSTLTSLRVLGAARRLGCSSSWRSATSSCLFPGESPASTSAAPRAGSSSGSENRGGGAPAARHGSSPPVLRFSSLSSFTPGRSSFRAFSTMAEGRESAGNNPGLIETKDEATKGYFIQQTMYRIRDPKVSLDFYTRILGMSLLKRLDFPEAKFSLYFLGYEDVTEAPADPADRVEWTFAKRATLELTHNWGTESDDNFKGHHNGNSDPRGYGHIGITVDDTYKACERFEQLGVKFVKKPDDGRMKGLAFIQDPDGYWIEIFDVARMGAMNRRS